MEGPAAQGLPVIHETLGVCVQRVLVLLFDSLVYLAMVSMLTDKEIVACLKSVYLREDVVVNMTTTEQRDDYIYIRTQITGHAKMSVTLLDDSGCLSESSGQPNKQTGLSLSCCTSSLFASLVNCLTKSTKTWLPPFSEQVLPSCCCIDSRRSRNEQRPNVSLNERSHQVFKAVVETVDPASRTMLCSQLD